MDTPPAAERRNRYGRVEECPAEHGGPALLFDNTSSDPQPAIELFTFDETKALLKLSTASLRRLQYSRQLSFLKVGGSVRFSKEDILSYLKSTRVEALDH